MKTRALLLALPILALSCRDNGASLQIQAICSPTDDCTFSDTCEAQYIGFPRVDRGLTDKLWLFLQVENQAPSNDNLDIGRTNTNDAHIDEMVVEYEGAAIGRQVSWANYYVPASGHAVVSVMAIPTGFGTALDDVVNAASDPLAGKQMTAVVKMRGYWDDGSRFETAEFPIAVTVCQGCNGAGCAAMNTCPPDSSGQDPVVCTTSS